MENYLHVVICKVNITMNDRNKTRAMKQGGIAEYEKSIRDV
ncbi:hypothetical protein [Dethiothermospora halolimnae]